MTKTFAPSAHASEIAATIRQAVRGPGPGTIEETDALRAIDQARHEETHPPTARQRRRLAGKHWSDRGHAVDGR